MLKPLPKSIDDIEPKVSAKKRKTLQEIENEMKSDDDDDDEEAPALEEVDREELERTKQ